MVVLQFLKTAHLSVIVSRFYDTPKLKNWMCNHAHFTNPVTIIIYVVYCIECAQVCGKDDFYVVVIISKQYIYLL